MIEINKPKKKVNWKQLETEANVKFKEIRTKGEKMWFIDMTQSDVNKIKTALTVHLATPRVNCMDKLNEILDILNKEKK